MYNPFSMHVANNPTDQHYLQHAHDKYMKRKHRRAAEVTVFIDRTGKRRHRIHGPSENVLPMMRIGESAQALASFFPSGIVHIERDFRAETEECQTLIAKYQKAS